MRDFKKIIIIGPQGSGKGTQAAALSKEFGLPHISTGAMFRGHINRVTSLGLQVRKILEQGQLVPDELTNQIVKERLAATDCQGGFILDGYPRNIEQVKFLEGLAKIDAVLEIWLSDQEVIRRLAGRRGCVCGAIYHLDYHPPQKENICDQCGQELKRRNDESDEALSRRLAIYHQQTEPLIEYYQKKGVLMEINGAPPITQVTAEIFIKLNNKDFS